MGRLFAVEIVYRGIFQKTLAKNISRGIVLAAHEEGKPGISFGRYGDSPERNGIPAKNFAIVATDDLTLEEGMAKYEPKEVDISIAVGRSLLRADRDRDGSSRSGESRDTVSIRAPQVVGDARRHRHPLHTAGTPRAGSPQRRNGWIPPGAQSHVQEIHDAYDAAGRG